MVGAAITATIAHSFEVEGETHSGCSVACKRLRICPGVGTVENIPGGLEIHGLESVEKIGLVVKIVNHCTLWWRVGSWQRDRLLQLMSSGREQLLVWTKRVSGCMVSGA